MDKNELIEKITSAFSGVTLGEGIGLWQAQAIDDYESKQVQLQKRESDEKSDWSKLLGYCELQRCHSSLSFFDAFGMRFHLPVFLIGSLKDEVDDPIFHLVSLDDYAKSKLTALNRAQKEAVVLYLKWCLQNPDYEFDHPSIKRALDEYWIEESKH